MKEGSKAQLDVQALGARGGGAGREAADTLSLAWGGPGPGVEFDIQDSGCRSSLHTTLGTEVRPT